MNVHKLLCWETQPVEVPVPDLVFSVEIEDLGVQMGDLHGYVIRSRVELQFSESGECKVCRVGVKLRWNRAVETTGRSCERCVLIDRERRDSREQENEEDSDAR